MEIQWVSPDSIKAYLRNPRKNAQAVDKVAQSLKTYGWQQPMVVDVEFVIIAGHTRWLAAQQLKMTQVPIHVAKALTPEQVRTYRIADNRLSEKVEWDEDLLREELNLLKEMEIELSLTGFDERELTQLLGALLDESTEEMAGWFSDAPVVSRPGERWELGEHRVMCGDATLQADVEKLLAGAMVDLVFTDPPYNVDYTQMHSPALVRRLQNDHLDDAAYLRFLRTALAQAAPFVKPTASWYVCHASQSQHLVQQALAENQLIVRSQIVWAKNHFVLNRGRYKTQHELIFYAYRRSQVDAWYGDRSQSTLWSIDKPLRCDLHPTMKPLALVQKALENSSLAGDRVLDMFGGSGSTLIACAQSHRTAYVMEMDPRYVDATVRRWQQHMGQAAVLSGTDRTFEDCVSARQGQQEPTLKAKRTQRAES